MKWGEDTKEGQIVGIFFLFFGIFFIHFPLFNWDPFITTTGKNFLFPDVQLCLFFFPAIDSPIYNTGSCMHIYPSESATHDIERTDRSL